MPTAGNIFSSGNVEIAFPWKTYIVHSDILRVSSGYFNGIFMWPGEEVTIYRSNDVHWSFVLGKDNFLQRKDSTRGISAYRTPVTRKEGMNQSAEDGNDQIVEQNFTEMVRTLYQCDLPPEILPQDPYKDPNRPHDDSTGEDKNTMGLLPGIQRAWDNMLRAFYHRPIQIAKITDICELIALADQYSALEATTPAVESRLYQQGQENLSNAIKLHPSIFLQVAYKIRSKILFREAFIHCVGQYALIKDHLHSPFSDPIYAEYQRLKDLRGFTNENILSFGFKKGVAVAAAVITAICEIFSWANRDYRHDTNFDGEPAGKLYRILSHDNFWETLSVWGNDDFKDDRNKDDPTFRCFGDKPTFKNSREKHLFKTYMKVIHRTTEHLAQNNLAFVPRLNHGIDYLLCAELDSEDFPGLKPNTDWPY